MADLQDELDSPAEAGADDERAARTHDVRPVPSPTDDRRTPEPAPEPLEPELRDALERAEALLGTHPVADGYSGLPGALRELPWYDLELGDSGLETDLPRLRAGRVGMQFWSLQMPDAEPDGDRAVSSALEQLDLVKHVVARYPDGLRVARDASETTDARNCGRIATLIGPASARAIGDSLGALRSLHTLGLSSLTLTGTSWAGADGLSTFGEEVVREMNRLGVLADLSGASEATAYRVLAVSKAPALWTRSGARALREHPANLSDELLASVGAAKGLCLVPLTADRTGPKLGDVADHLEHVRRVAGAECVGISGMYDTRSGHPGELTDASRYPRLVAELFRRGWSEAEVMALTWGNVQRVLRGADFTARAARERRGASTATIGRLDG
ncbi:dipeptidase [Streptomyces flavofungini]|uniref:Dipeptidase n=1 Tax=Streptomyces flavofungini TaxID=68200 RepID=A0ABS0XCC5_9ACTN|nr:dipeptidase [Streptomyces flavofungini]MBJ3810873.1 dipeptidase [Streptomyces flavofungini]GHC62738.1 dipeptidase [Streptomyces flavofungini]